MKKRKQAILSLLLIGMLLISVGCSSDSVQQRGENTGDSDGKIIVVTTIGQIADMVEQVGGEYVEVRGLMGPGVDPHLYKASQGDIAKMEAAEIIFYNGLNLEGKMADIFVRMASQKPAIAVSEYLGDEELMEPEAFAGHYDPHIWFDLHLWQKAVERVRDGLIELAPEHRADFERNAEAYMTQLEELHQYALESIATIPEESRVLVTAHDAFGYFGEAYGMEVVGLQGISTDAEYGVMDVQNLVEMLVERKIKAVFIESSVPPTAIEAVVEGTKAQGHEVTIGGELFSDAMGEAGTPEGTFLGMFRHNVDTIVQALR